MVRKGRKGWKEEKEGCIGLRKRLGTMVCK